MIGLGIATFFEDILFVAAVVAIVTVIIVARRMFALKIASSEKDTSQAQSNSK